MNLENLDSRIRQLMLDAIAHDEEKRALYMSPRLNAAGQQQYAALLKETAAGGDAPALAQQLRVRGCIAESETRNLKGGRISIAKIPVTAADTLAEGEFNRFYLRALCLAAIEDGTEVEAYRARHSDNPRLESQAVIGKAFDPTTLLADLRANTGVDTCFGLPPGPNSGLSGRLRIKK